MLNKEQLLSIGISSGDADKILAQYNTQEVAESFIEDVESVKEQLPERMELPPPTDSDITSISDLKKYTNGQVVRLPDFAEGQPFVARLKRPSMLVLVKSGKIPNSLLDTASSLFDGKGSKNTGDSEKAMQDMYGVLCIIAEASLVEPSYKEIKANNIELTDEQLIAIFNYSQQGIEGLKSFR